MNKNWCPPKYPSRRKQATSHDSHYESKISPVRSYKGVCLKRTQEGYVIARPIQIKGFPEDIIQSVQGSWQRAGDLRRLIDYGLEHVDAQRWAEVREALFNWTCSSCKSTQLFVRADVDSIYVKEWGHTGKMVAPSSLAGSLVQCPCCGFRTVYEDLERVSDEIFF